MSLQSKLRFLRQNGNVTQQEVASRLEIDRSYYSRMERMERPMDLDLFEKAVEFTGCGFWLAGRRHADLARILNTSSPNDLDFIQEVASALPKLTPEVKSSLRALVDHWRSGGIDKDKVS